MLLNHKTPPSASGSAGAPDWGPNRALLVAAGVLALAGLAWLFYPADTTPEMPSAAPVRPTLASASQPAPDDSAATVWRLQENVPTWKSASPQASSEPANGSDPNPDLSHYVPRGAKPSMPEVIQRLHDAGVYTGLGAFNPPGTRPPMVGLAVPENYPLPAGFVRHHQATDDGQRIEPILMFAPDFQLYDAQKQPIDMPKNRVVTAELAPPGFPIRLIVLPAPLAQPQ